MVWREEDHPRDDDGKFTDGNGTYRQNSLEPYRKTHDKIALNFFSRNKLKRKNEKIISQAQDVPSPPREAMGFANRERLTTKHHLRHVLEMGFKDPKDYQRGAIEFWKHGNGKVYYSSSKDMFYRYDAPTRRYLSISTDGIIHTFYFKKLSDFEFVKRTEVLHEL